jgi:hypothetical protein
MRADSEKGGIEMDYRLNKKFPGFQVTREGKFEWRRYIHGQTYNEVPPEDAHRFEKIGTEKQGEENREPGIKKKK